MSVKWFQILVCIKVETEYTEIENTENRLWIEL